jgi:RNA recognition motif-containing protein
MQSPGTPPGPEDKPEAVAVSESSVVSGDDTPSSTALFFARVPPLVPYQDLYALFSKFGTVSDLSLFRRWATARTSKGCGTVKFCKPEAASAALLALNGVHSFDAYPGCEGPMVVEWMDVSRLSSAHSGVWAWGGGRGGIQQP